VKEKLLYRHKPKRALIVDGIFTLIFSTLVFYFLTKGPWQLSLVFGFALLNVLKGLVTASVIEIWDGQPDFIYRRTSILGRKTTLIPCVEIEGVETRITSMWRGNISEKLVLCAGGREYLLSPYYSESDPATAMVYQTIHSLKAAGEDHQNRQRRILAKKQKPRVKKVERLVWGMIEMSIQCPRCEAHVPINGPFTDFQCPECFEKLELSPENWADLLEDVRNDIAREMEPGEGTNSSIMGVFNASLLYARMVPYCRKCKEDFKNPKEGAERVECPCGGSLPVTEPPPWFGKVFKGAKYIVGATRSTSHGDQKPEPVMMTCSSCGASFETHGENRNASCSHCGTSVFLPDDLWFHFHPAPVKTRWFVGFTAKYKEEQSQEY
jgi:DNA-directed RNA polymerase subunit RPC12/RpoP